MMNSMSKCRDIKGKAIDIRHTSTPPRPIVEQSHRRIYQLHSIKDQLTRPALKIPLEKFIYMTYSSVHAPRPPPSSSKEPKVRLMV